MAVFDLQDRITENVVAPIEPKLQLAEIERLKRKPAANLNAYDHFLRAQQLEYEFTDDSLKAAIGHLRQAIEIDPSYAPAIGLDTKHAQELVYRSLETNPNSAIACTIAGWIEAYSGRYSKGKELLGRARRLSPRDPRAWFTASGMAIACLGESAFEGGRRMGDEGAGAKPALHRGDAIVGGQSRQSRADRRCQQGDRRFPSRRAGLDAHEAARPLHFHERRPLGKAIRGGLPE
jgi:tetratricopeptide (TPR) repeat protein